MTSTPSGHRAPQPAADPAPTGRLGAAVARPPVWDSRTLLGTGTLAHITHQGQTYRLQLTRQGKLILGK